MREHIVLLQAGNAPPDFANEALIRGAKAILWISDEERDSIRSQIQLAPPEQLTLTSPTLPILRIRPHVAEALLAPLGLKSTDLLAEDNAADQQGPGWFARQLGISVQVSVQLDEVESGEIPMVIGYLPGSDFDIAEELVILYTSYDGLGKDPDGSVFPAVNHGATGVAMQLELARLWHQQGIKPRRSLLFVAWGASTLDVPGATAYLEDPFNLRHLDTPSGNQNLKPAAVIQLDYLGAGRDALFIDPRSDKDLAAFLQEMVAVRGIAISDEIQAHRHFDDRVTHKFPWLGFAWTQADFAPDQDTLDHISVDKLQTLGEALALALTKIARETTY